MVLHWESYHGRAKAPHSSLQCTSSSHASAWQTWHQSLLSVPSAQGSAWCPAEEQATPVYLRFPGRRRWDGHCPGHYFLEKSPLALFPDWPCSQAFLETSLSPSLPHTYFRSSSPSSSSLTLSYPQGLPSFRDVLLSFYPPHPSPFPYTEDTLLLRVLHPSLSQPVGQLVSRFGVYTFYSFSSVGVSRLVRRSPQLHGLLALVWRHPPYTF